jgi:hypothetical protein
VSNKQAQGCGEWHARFISHFISASLWRSRKRKRHTSGFVHPEIPQDFVVSTCMIYTNLVPPHTQVLWAFLTCSSPCFGQCNILASAQQVRNCNEITLCCRPKDAWPNPLHFRTFSSAISARRDTNWHRWKPSAHYAYFAMLSALNLT